MTLRSQRRLAASLLKAGLSRVWIDPEENDRVRSAITREEIKTLIREGRIRLLPITGVSRGRVRTSKRKSAGSRKRGQGLGKTQWVLKIRAIRRHLRGLRDSSKLTPAGSINNKDVYVQIAESRPGGDTVTASASSKELAGLGWKAGTGNIPSAYLT